MKKKNINLKKLNFNKTAIAILSTNRADQVKGGGTILSICEPCDGQSRLDSCDDFCADTRKACPFETRFIDCLSQIPDRC